MAPPLTIRNLTSRPLELKLIERFEAANSSHSVFSSIGRNITYVTSFVTGAGNSANTAAPTSAQLAQNAQSFNRQDAGVRIEPFGSHTVEAVEEGKAGNETLRLTFECEGQRYRIDTPGTKESQSFTPLQPNPSHELTGVYLNDDAFLSIYSSANLQCWMKGFRDETPLSALSIPGTHNSPTCHHALPSVRCQAVGLGQQLENGVRFFDIRVQPQYPDDPSKDGLILVHGVFPISLTGTKLFRDMMKDVHRFLDANPTEAIIMSLKREGAGSATDQQLSRILHDHYANDPQRWYTEPRVPRLGEVRGKIVLMRRFALAEPQKQAWGGRGWAINAECWRYNCDKDLHGDVWVQDFCEVNETRQIDEKIQFAQAHLDLAGRCVVPLPMHGADGGADGADGADGGPEPLPFFLNFLSASNFWRFACWPEKIAARLNPAITKHLCMAHHGGGDGDGATGIVVCDWVGQGGDWDLVRCIVGMNARLEMRSNGVR